ncbi:MAG: peptide chain release factor N(5)-glutamine methyltransferase [Crocinitomicaceae bacterium]
MWKTLICKRFNWSGAEFILNQKTALSESDLLYVRDFVKRLQSNEPFQYIIGETSFYNLTISCNSSALIPRPETEELVNWIRNSTANPLSILDIGTGTGCIALALKSVYSNAHVEAWDVSDAALLLARKNALHLNLRVDFKNMNVLNTINPDRKFDVFVSNPPYVQYSEKGEMEHHVKDFEPHLALFVHDEDPLIFYKKIADLSLLNLNPNGLLFFETHHKFHNELEREMKKRGFINIELRKDLQGLDRFLKAQIP